MLSTDSLGARAKVVTTTRLKIDIEPDAPQEKLVNVVLRDCLTEHNTGYGYYDVSV